MGGAGPYWMRSGLARILMAFFPGSTLCSMNALLCCPCSEFSRRGYSGPRLVPGPSVMTTVVALLTLNAWQQHLGSGSLAAVTGQWKLSGGSLAAAALGRQLGSSNWAAAAWEWPFFSGSQAAAAWQRRLRSGSQDPPSPQSGNPDFPCVVRRAVDGAPHPEPQQQCIQQAAHQHATEPAAHPPNRRVTWAPGLKVHYPLF